MGKSDRVFVDSNVWFSYFWGSKTIQRLIDALRDKKRLVISELVLAEVAENIKLKLPSVLDEVRNVFTIFPLTVVKDPDLKTVSQVKKYCDSKDAPILAACLKSNSGFLITGNLKDFQVKKIKKMLGITVISPSQFLKRQ